MSTPLWLALINEGTGTTLNDTSAASRVVPLRVKAR